MKGIRKDGYLSVITMPNMGRSMKNYTTSKRTPYNLTRNELRKKLCELGPTHCNEQCENWSVCSYGKAWVKGAKTNS
jgi:23S rRNA A2030 N6-methylase RlmJ